MDVDKEDFDADAQQIYAGRNARKCWEVSRHQNHVAMPFHTFSVKRGGKQVQAILSASWMQKWRIAHKFTTGWEDQKGWNR